jgi:hypothetical protein
VDCECARREAAVPLTPEGADVEEGSAGEPWNALGGALAGVRAEGGLEAGVRVGVGVGVAAAAVVLAFVGEEGNRDVIVAGASTLACRTAAGFVEVDDDAVDAGAQTGAGSASGRASGIADDGSSSSCVASALGDASGVGNDGLGGVSSCADASGVVALVCGSGSCLGCGGHSRLSFASIFAASPDGFDSALDVREGVPCRECRFVCCSNRPMRFATLWRGRSSGSGLQMHS